MCDVLM